jgi:hypothetical protein
VTGERAAGALRKPLDQWGLGEAVDDVVEAMVRAHPIVREPPAVGALGRLVAQRLCRAAELALGRLQLVQIGLGELRSGNLSRQAPFKSRLGGF